MYLTTAIIISLCLASATTGRTINDTNEYCTTKKRTDFKKRELCVLDFIKRNGSCSDINDVRKTYRSFIKTVPECLSDVALTNTSINLRIGLIEHVFKHDATQGFYKANGTNCIKSKGLEIIKCVEDTIKGFNKTTITKQMRFSLIKLKHFELEEKPFVENANIYNCTLNILRSSCNETAAFVKSIQGYILQEFVKYKHEKSHLSPEAPSRKGTTIIVTVLIVIVLLFLAFIVIKKTLWQRWRRQRATYRCTYKAKEENGENSK